MFFQNSEHLVAIFVDEYDKPLLQAHRQQNPSGGIPKHTDISMFPQYVSLSGTTESESQNIDGAVITYGEGLYPECDADAGECDGGVF